MEENGRKNSPSTLHDERILPVPLRVKTHNVVAPLESRDRMRPVEFLQPDLQRPPSHIHTAHEPHHFPLQHRLIPHLVHRLVELGQPRQEFRPARRALEFGRDERLHGEAVRARDLHARQSGQDDEFPRHVEAVEVVAGVGFREAGFLGLEDGGAPFVAFAASGRRGEGVEEEAHGAGEDAFDAAYGVAGSEEVVERGDDGEAGADGGFVVDEPSGEIGGVGVEGRFVDLVP